MESLIIWLFAIEYRIVFCLGSKDLKQLHAYINGYVDALAWDGDDRARKLMEDFQRFVQVQYAVEQTAKGWNTLIRERAENDAQAMETFYALFLSFCMCGERAFNLQKFVQPMDVPHRLAKSSWAACAAILCSQQDERLMPLLPGLFMWLRDMNWPGAAEIAKRLHALPKDVLASALTEATEQAQAENDEEWLYYLREEFGNCLEK